MASQSFSDQMGFRIAVPYPPKRIVSLVPSQTELLSFFGLNDAVVGITKFCIHPHEWRFMKTVVGGTKKFHFDIIAKLNPDLIIGNKEENYQEGIEKLRQDFPVWMSDIVTLRDAFSMIESLALITGKKSRGDECISRINEKLNGVRRYQGQSVLYLIWKDPWMAAGRNTFIDSILDTLGLKNVLESKYRYPALSMDEIRRLKPRYIFLSSEPYPFGPGHAEEIRRLNPASKILSVDGEMFSWYGSRLIKAFDYFNTLALA